MMPRRGPRADETRRSRAAAALICVLLLPLATAAGGEGASRGDWNAEYLAAAAGCPPGSPERSRLLLAAGAWAEAVAEPAAGDSFPRAVALAALERWAEVPGLLPRTLKNPLLERYRLLLRARSGRGLGDAEGALAECDAFIDAPSVPAPWLESGVLDVVAEVAPGEWERFAETMPEATPSARALASVAVYRLRRGDLAGAERSIARSGAAPGSPPATDAVVLLGADSLLAVYGRETLEALVALAAKAGREETALAAGRVAGRRFGAAGRLVEARALERTGSPRKARRIYRRLYLSNEAIEVKRDALLGMAAVALRLGEKEAADLYRTFGMYYPGDDRSLGALDTAARIEIARRRPSRAMTILAELRGRGETTICREAALAEAILRVDAGESRQARRILRGLVDGRDRRLEPWALVQLAKMPGEDDRDEWRNRLLGEYPSSAAALFLREGPAGFVSTDAKGGDTVAVGTLSAAERDAFERFAGEAAAPPRLAADARHAAWRYALATGLLDSASRIGDALVDAFGDDAGARIALYREAREAGLVRIALRAAVGVDGNRPGREGALLPVAHAGVLAGAAGERGLPPALLLAVMREESLFDPGAVSRAGARGLMQLMPPTARWIGGKLGRAEVEEGDLHDPAFSLRAGAWYLRFLLDRGESSIVAAVASYNAGHGKMRNWRKTFIPSRYPMAAVEMIGPAETRRYTRRVLDAWAAYRSVPAGNGVE